MWHNKSLATELEETINRTSSQSYHMSSSSIDSLSLRLKRQEHIIVKAQRLLRDANGSLWDAEKQVSRRSEAVSSQNEGLRRANATLTSVKLYLSTKYCPQASKAALVPLESPLNYLRNIIKTYEEELCTCEEALRDLCLFVPTGEVDIDRKQKLIARSLLDSTEETLRLSKTKYTSP